MSCSCCPGFCQHRPPPACSTLGAAQGLKRKKKSWPTLKTLKLLTKEKKKLLIISLSVSGAWPLTGVTDTPGAAERPRRSGTSPGPRCGRTGPGPGPGPGRSSVSHPPRTRQTPRQPARPGPAVPQCPRPGETSPGGALAQSRARSAPPLGPRWRRDGTATPARASRHWRAVTSFRRRRKGWARKRKRSRGGPVAAGAGSGSAKMSEPELLLDSNIRLWVVLPIVFITFFVGMIRHYVSILLQSDKRLTQEQVSDRSGPPRPGRLAAPRTPHTPSHPSQLLAPPAPRPAPLTPLVSLTAKSSFGAESFGKMENTSPSRYGAARAALCFAGRVTRMPAQSWGCMSHYGCRLVPAQGPGAASGGRRVADARDPGRGTLMLMLALTTWCFNYLLG